MDELATQLGGVQLTPSGSGRSQEPEVETVQAAFKRFFDEKYRTKKTKRPRPGSKRYNKAYGRFLIDEVQQLYGTNELKLHVLQDLCRDAQVAQIPDSINKCKKV